MGPLVQFALVAIGTLACVAFAWRARRWRRRGDHPHCRRCDFDLFGLPAGAGRCSECGADLTAKRAIAIGARRPMRVVQGGAAAAAIAFGVVAIRFERGVDWYQSAARVAPTALLIHELNSDGRARAAAAEELNRRVQSDAYAGAPLDRVAHALWAYRVTVRPSVVIGNSLPAVVAAGPRVPSGSRAASAPPIRYVIFHQLVRYRFGDGEWQYPGYGWWSGDVAAEWLTTFSFNTYDRTLRPGDATLECDCKVRLVRLEANSPWFKFIQDERRKYRDDDPSVVAWDESIRVPVRLVARESNDDVELVHDERLREAIRRSITIGDPKNALPVMRKPVVTIAPENFYVDGAIVFDRPPIDLAYDVFMRHPTLGTEIDVGGWAQARAGRRSVFELDQTEASSKTMAFFSDWSATHADLVLRPSPHAAESSTDLLRVSGDEIVLKDIPIEILHPTTTRSAGG